MDINYVAVGLAALAAFFLGFMWYTIVFAKPWQKLIGMGEKGKSTKSTDETPDLGRLLGGSFVLWVVMAFNLAVLIGDDTSWSHGLTTGLTVGFGFIALATAVHYMFEGRPLKLWLINAGYMTVVFSVMGFIIGVL